MSIQQPERIGNMRNDDFLLEVWRRFNFGMIVDGSLQCSSTGGNIGVGQVNSITISSAATNLLEAGTDEQVQRFTAQAGGGAYTYNIDLDLDTYEGAVFHIYVDKAASANPTVRVRNGSGGSTLVTINSGIASTYALMFIFDGTNWVKHIAILNDI